MRSLSCGPGWLVLTVCAALAPGLWTEPARAEVVVRRWGTAGAALRAAVGRRVRLLIPVGLEKRVNEDVAVLAAAANAPDGQGPRLLPLPGEVFTELDAIALMTGATARLLAAGGVYGAEGAVWIGLSGPDRQVQEAEALINSLAGEPPCQG